MTETKLQKVFELQVRSVASFVFIAQAKHWLPRLLWTLLTLAVCGICINNMISAWNKYTDRETIVQLSIKNEHSPFPTVTICNMNPYKRSMVEKLENFTALISAYQQLSEQIEAKNKATTQIPNDKTTVATVHRRKRSLPTCSCAVSHPNQVGNVLYNGKCYLWYENAVTQNKHPAAQNKCMNTTTTICADNPSRSCTTDGVGRLATFDSWTDFNAVTSAFNVTTFQPINIGIDCNSATQAVNEDPYNVCTPAPTPFNIGDANWPSSALSGGSFGGMSCNGGHPYVTVMSPWNVWNTQQKNAQVPGYICEVGKSYY